MVVKKRLGSAGGVGAAQGVVTERIDSAGGVVAARGVASERLDPAGGVGVPVVLLGAHRLRWRCFGCPWCC